MSQLLSKTSFVLIAFALCNAPSLAMAGTCGVLPFSAGEDVNRGAGPNITALVSSELDIRGGYDLVIAAPPEDFEGGDCGASINCIKEFSRANKHEAVVAGTVVSDGDEYTLTIKLHDGNNASLIRQVTQNVPSSALDLADAVTDVVIELVTGSAPERGEDASASADDGPLFDDVDFDELLDEAESEVEEPKKKRRSRAAPRNPSRDDEVDFNDEDDEDDDPFGIDELDELDMSADQIEKQKRDRQRQAEIDRARRDEEERLAKVRAQEERERRIAEEREREARERARRELEERQRQARIDAERQEEQERQARIRQKREREERERIQEERDQREREEREREARAEREDRERRARERTERESRAREEDERQARADRDRRDEEDRRRREREDRERRDREDREEDSNDGGMMLGSALALGPASGIIIGSGDDDDDDDDDEYGGGIVIGAVDDEDDYYEDEDEEPREGMIISDGDGRESPNVRRRREAESGRDSDPRDDRYSRARSFDSSSNDRARRDDDGRSARRDYDEDEDLDLLDDEYDDRRSDSRSYSRGNDDRDYDDRSYRERSYGSEPVASRSDSYLSSDYDGKDGNSRSYTARRKKGAESNLSRSKTGWGNRPWFSARLSGGYTNYYLHFAQYGLDLGFFPVPRVSVDLQADFWTLSIRDCPDCEQQYRTLPSFYLGGSYRFTNLKIVQPYVGGDVGAVVYAVGVLTGDNGEVTRRPLMGVAFEVKGGADFMFTRHFGLGAGVKAGLAYASLIQENVHPEWNPLQFLLNVRLSAVVQF